jgi:hypothetical protein
MLAEDLGLVPLLLIFKRCTMMDLKICFLLWMKGRA